MKNKRLVIAKILYVLLLTGMIILILLTNSKINIALSKTFTKIYFFLIIVNLIYVPSITLRNIKKSKSTYIKRALKKFILFFIITIIFYCILNFIFDRFTLLQILTKSFLVSFVVSFMDIAFLDC